MSKRVMQINTIRIKENGECYQCNVFPAYVYRDIEENGIYEYPVNTFKDLLILVENGDIPKARIERTLFKNKKYVSLYNADCFDREEITEKNFKPFYFRVTYSIDYSPSIKKLMEELTADEFAEWCYDKKISLDEIKKGEN